MCCIYLSWAGILTCTAIGCKMPGARPAGVQTNAASTEELKLVSTDEWRLLGGYQGLSDELDLKEKDGRAQARILGRNFSESWRKYLREQIEKTYPADERVEDLKTLNAILKKRVKAKDAELSVYRRYLLDGGDKPPE